MAAFMGLATNVYIVYVYRLDTSDGSVCGFSHDSIGLCLHAPGPQTPAASHQGQAVSALPR